MEAVILVIHLIVTLALIGMVLLQRSEGGGLGIGGGSGGLGALAGAPTTANVMTRTTAILATMFFVTNLSLAYIAKSKTSADSVINQVGVEETIEGSEMPSVPADGESTAAEQPAPVVPIAE